MIPPGAGSPCSAALGATDGVSRRAPTRALVACGMDFAKAILVGASMNRLDGPRVRSDSTRVGLHPDRDVLIHASFVDHVDSRSRPACGDDLLHARPVPHHPLRPFPRRQIPLAVGAEDPQAAVPQRADLDRFAPQLLVAGDDDEIACCGRRNPLGVECTARTLRDQRISNVDGVLASRRQGKTKADRTLVDVEPNEMLLMRRV